MSGTIYLLFPINFQQYFFWKKNSIFLQIKKTLLSLHRLC